MKFLALDVGEKRIGVARGDDTTRIAVPVGFVETGGQEWQEIARIANFYGVKRFIVGLPRNNQGVETAQSEYAREFVRQLVKRIPGIRVKMQDETLTSVLAEERLKQRGKPYQRGDIDAEAATIILQDYFDGMTASAGASEINAAALENAVVAAPEAAQGLSSDLAQDLANFQENEAQNAPETANLAQNAAQSTSETANLAPQSDENLNVREDPKMTKKRRKAAKKAQKTAKKQQKQAKKRSSGRSKGSVIGGIISGILIIGVIGVIGTIGFLYLKHQRDAEREAELAAAAAAMEPQVFDFTVLPGETIYDIEGKLIEVGYSEREVEQAMLAKNYDFPMLKELEKNDTVEGYLFGETKQFYNDTPVTEVVEFFLQEMQDTIDENNLEALYAEQGLCLNEGIILASVVQKEAKAADMPTVAQVFLTRLAEGIALGSDVTVSYALDATNPSRSGVMNNQAALEVDSCYNTRLYRGLPCGPISNPGLNALLAVAEPSDTSYLYFLTGDDGLMYYSYTEDEHTLNTQLHCQDLCNVSL